VQYCVTFTGYLNDLFRPLSFPKTVSDYVIVTAANPKELSDKVGAFFGLFTQMQGMMIRKNSTKPIDPGKADADRMFIPMQMFSRIDSVCLPLAGEVPEVNPEGEIVVPSGKKVWKN
jgi:hypothetical protein